MDSNKNLKKGKYYEVSEKIKSSLKIKKKFNENSKIQRSIFLEKNYFAR